MPYTFRAMPLRPPSVPSTPRVHAGDKFRSFWQRVSEGRQIVLRSK